MFNLINNPFSEKNKVIPFTREEISSIVSEIKVRATDPKSKDNLDLFIKSKLNPDLLNQSLEYLADLDKFLRNLENVYLSEKNSEFKSHYRALHDNLLIELGKIQVNISSLVSNARSLKKVKTQIYYYDKIFNSFEKLSNLLRIIRERITNRLNNAVSDFQNNVLLWTESAKIKNTVFVYKEETFDFLNWKEFANLRLMIESFNDAHPKLLQKKKRHKQSTSFAMNELVGKIETRHKSRIPLYLELLHLLNTLGVIKEDKNGQFYNVVTKKEIQDKIDGYFEKLLRLKAISLFSEFLSEMLKRNPSEKDLEKLEHKLTIIIKTNVSLLFSEASSYFFRNIDDRFYSIAKTTESKAEIDGKIKEIYSELDTFNSIYQKIVDWISSIEKMLSPFDGTSKKFNVIISNVISDIERRKIEYKNYIKTMKDEEIRLDVRNFVDTKISELNGILAGYETETSTIIKEELPQLKQITKILNEFKTRIQKIKKEVYTKLDLYKEDDIDLYQIIKKWENVFSQKRQQMSFLIRLLLNKLFKNFKDLLEEEGYLFATITEISKQINNFESLPLNFAISEILAEKLSEDELRDRMSEIKSKIDQLNKSLGLYQVELTKLEKVLETKVKRKNGITDSKIQCTICHDNINFVKDNIITCPFCSSTYHYLCVASWLSNHNSCPHCQNSFLNPNSGLFEEHLGE